MNDTNPTQSADPVDDIRTQNKALVFAALAAAGIDHVTVEYDGSGDSGQIDNVEARNTANERTAFPSEATIQLVSENPHHLLPGQNLEAAVESLAWDYLEDLYNGWANNDGAFGSFVFDVPGRSIRFEHNERYTDVNTTTHEF